MSCNKFVLLVFFSFGFLFCAAQNIPVPYFKGAIKENRINTRRNIIINIINKNLSLPLTDSSSEENWEDAFGAMEVLQYKSPWIDNCVQYAFDSVEKRSVDFQRSLLELCYANYPNTFVAPVTNLIGKTYDSKIFALCTEYLLRIDSSEKMTLFILEQPLATMWTVRKDVKSILYQSVWRHVIKQNKLSPLFSKDFLKNNVVVFSIQRKNRDYSGIAVVRDANGNFIRNKDSSIFYVPQLARSISNLPFYLTNGNTPQGIFRMDGLAISGADFIGPTQNIQLTIPFETSIKHFLKDSTLTDTTWTIDLYKKLLPFELKDSTALYETYYAGETGRTEIIAHGTTINQDYYKDKPYYPQTPTMGCLCTEEIWSSIDGKRIESDQQQLVDAVKKAGGADGYYIVIEIDDQQKPVGLQEILPFIK